MNFSYQNVVYKNSELSTLLFRFYIYFPFFFFKASSEVGELNVVTTEYVETADVSKSVIVYVSITGAVLVLINAALVACFVLKRRSRRLKGEFTFILPLLFHF